MNHKADKIAVQACKDMYPEDNLPMRSVAAIIAMEAISVYCREVNRLKRGKKTRSNDQEGK